MASNRFGAPVRRKEDRRFLMGTGQYIDDIRLPGMLHLAVLRSAHSHAALRRVDMAPALALPGVVTGYTGADLPADMPPIPMRIAAHPDLEPFLQCPLARNVVRYVGEPIAVVIADSRYRAEDALDQIAVDYEPLAPVVEPEAATRPDAPHVFPERHSNTALTLTQHIGDVDRALEEADVVLTERFVIQRHTGMPMETRGLMAGYDKAREQLTVWGITKIPYANRTVLAGALGLPEHRVRCLGCDVGGGFGVRGELYPEDVLVCYSAYRLGRPVKWVEDRREHFLATNHSREQIHDVTIGVRRDGTILALRNTLYSDMGAYIRTHGVLVPMNTVIKFPGPYKVPNYAYTMHAVMTNKTPVGTYRAPGAYEANFVRERLLDMVAERLGLDPVVVRQHNLVQPEDMPYDVGTRALDRSIVYDSGNFPRTLASVLDAVGYAAFRERQQLLWSQGRYQGIGVVVFAEKTGLGPFESARIRIDGSGQAIITTGATPMGQGLETTLSQIAAEVLQLPSEAITVRWGDTEEMPYGVGSYASRTTVMAGSAVHRAAIQLRDKIRRVAATYLEAAAKDIILRDGAVHVQGTPHITLSFRELAALASPAQWQRPEAEPGLEVATHFQASKSTYGTGSAAVVLEVDIETGQITIWRTVIAYDVGRAINPMLVEGQIIGGAVQGLSGALLEELRYDDSGQLLTATFMDYLLPTAADVPVVETHLLEDTPSQLNPLGVKGVGEGGIAGMGGAVANAVADALRPLGVKVTELPLHPNAVYQALHRR